MKIKLESIDKEVTLAEAKALFEELKVLFPEAATFLPSSDPNELLKRIKRDALLQIELN